jgi:hypothetical protein
MIIIIDDKKTVKPCGKCGEGVDGTHRCIDCNTHMHVFCGVRVGEEGFGQRVYCPKCSKTKGVNEDEPFLDENLDIIVPDNQPNKIKPKPAPEKGQKKKKK